MARAEELLIRDKLLRKARFKFALDCLQIIEITPFENIAFSPYSLYEGLMMIYFASSGLTEKYLKCFLNLPEELHEELSKIYWISHNSTERIKENREKLNGYYDQNICWINKAKLLKDIGPSLFNPNKFIEFDFNDIMNTGLMHRINEVLRNEMQSYILKPIEFNKLNEHMEFVLSSILCFRNDTFQHEFLTNVSEKHFQRQPRTCISSKLNMLVTELPYVNKTQSLFALFPAVQHDSETNIWQIDENISELVKRLTTLEGMKELYKILNDKESSTKLPTTSVIYPDFFELESELQIDKLLDILKIKSILKPQEADLHGFSHLKLKVGDVKHRTYIKVAQQNIVTASSINMFFTEYGGSFSLNQELNKNTKYENSFIWLIYDRYSYTILFIGVINEM